MFKQKFFTLSFGIGILGCAIANASPVINETLKLLPDDGLPDDRFGFSSDISNGIVAIGAKWVDENGFNSGAAYLLDASSGAQIAKLLADDGAANDEFGSAIAIDGNYVVVGTFQDSENGPFSGSVYLFDVSTGDQLFKITPDDGAPQDEFGRSIAIDNGLIAVAALKDDDNGSGSGSAYVFEAASGQQIAKLLPDDGAINDRFGSSIAISNGIVAVGAQSDDDHGTNSGSAYLFDALTGEQIAKLTPDDGIPFVRFGNSIAIDANIVAVGAWWDIENGNKSGSAYLFDVKTGQQLAKLIPDDGAPMDQFSESIGISDGIVAISARYDDDNGTDSGSIYLFDASTGTQLTKLLASDGFEQDWFGSTLGIDHGVLATGADRDDDGGIWSGSAYVFDLTCPADLNRDGTLNFFDVSAFLVAFHMGDPLADITGDGNLDMFDVSAFLSAFNAGCPLMGH
jgi:FG-GAP repeat